MPVQIAGHNFTGFPARDSADLRRLKYSDRIKWLRYRFQLVFLTPWNALLNQEGADCYIWLCVLNLACSAMETMASFEFSGTGAERFVTFVERYFPHFREVDLHLHDPCPERGRRPASKPAEHLYKYFRSGLAHSFCIEWGGILHQEDGAPTYLWEADTGQGVQKGLGIAPREFVSDFLNAAEEFFTALANREPGDPLASRFNDRFEEVFLMKNGAPVP